LGQEKISTCPNAQYVDQGKERRQVLANIEERKTRDGKKMYRVKVRLKGFPTQTKSIFSVVREDDSVFAHKRLSYDGKDELN
jgi:hypothetical protein